MRHTRSCQKKPSVVESTKLTLYRCPLCLMCFNKRQTRNSHSLTCQTQLFSCSKCDKTFLKEEYLKLHERTHQDEGHSWQGLQIVQVNKDYKKIMDNISVKQEPFDTNQNDVSTANREEIRDGGLIKENAPQADTAR